MPIAYFLAPHPDCVTTMGPLCVPIGFPQGDFRDGCAHEGLCICAGNFPQDVIDTPPVGVTKLTAAEVRTRVELVIEATT